MRKFLFFSIPAATLLGLPAWRAVLTSTKYGTGDFRQILSVVAGTLGIALVLHTIGFFLRKKNGFNYLFLPAFVILAALLVDAGNIFKQELFQLLSVNINLSASLEALTLASLLLLFFALSRLFPDGSTATIASVVEVSSPLILVFVATGFVYLYQFRLGSNADLPTGNRQAIVLLMDELDWKFVRQNQKKLIGFDLLRSSGVTFNFAYPPSNSTVHSVPSYWVGHTVDGATNSYDGVKIRHNGAELDISNSLFAERLRTGDSVSIQGWFLEYCRTFRRLPEIKCHDHNRFNVPGEKIGMYRWMIGNSYVLEKLRTAFSDEPRVQRMIDRIYRSAAGSFWYNQLAVFDAAQKNVDFEIRGKTNLIFWHMNCPHLPSFYDSEETWGIESESRRNEKSYLKNLFFCDKALSRVRATLDDQGNPYMLIVVSDHWFRDRAKGTVTSVQPVPLFVGFSRSERVNFTEINERVNAAVIKNLIDGYLDGGVTAVGYLLENTSRLPVPDTKLIYDENFELLGKGL